MWFWVVFAAVLFALLVVALYRARRGWRHGSPSDDAQAEARAAAYLARLHRTPPPSSF